jgi:glycosyltransferase involved in cell wall biosynthesis
MNLLLQPSFTESFNGVTADGIAEGVPSVVGPAIDWVPGNWIVNPDDAVEVAEAGMRLLGDRGAARAGYEALSAHNRDAIASWRRFLV